MDRIVRGTAPTLYNTFSVAGTPTDPAPDSCTVEVLRGDGTTLVPSTAADEAGTGRFSLTLTTEETASLDLLEANWTADFGGVPQTMTTYVEIAGGVLFTLPEARQLTALADETKYPTDRLVAARVAAEQAIEDRCEVAFVPRAARETLDGTGRTALSLLRPLVRRITALEINGDPVTDLDGIVPVPGGAYWASKWAAGYSNVVIAYEHGYDRPPERIKRAAIRLVKHYLVDSIFDDRALRVDVEDGSFVMATPGAKGSFGIPEVDSAVADYSFHTGIA